MTTLMAKTFLPILRDRIAHLADTLAELRRRVREAVAVEMGRIVSETVRDLLTDLLRRSAVDPDATDDPRTAHAARHDDWTDDDELDRGASRGADHQEPAPERTGSRFWPVVLSFGLTVARWLFRHKTNWWPTAGFGNLVVDAPLVRHPLTRSSLAAVATAAELVRLTAPNATRP